MADTLLRLDTVMDRTGLKRSKLYRMISDGAFPEPIKIDGCAVWPSGAIDQWINDRIAAWQNRAA